MQHDSYDFSEEEIRQQLEKFGFHNIPCNRLKDFKKDLEALIHSERIKLSHEARQNMSYTSNSATESSPAHSPTAEAPHAAIQRHYPYRPTNSVCQPQYSLRSDADTAVSVHVTGVDPSMRRVHARDTYRQDDGRLTRSAPTSPSKSVVSSEGERKQIKRKVLRKVNGESIVDESFIDSESDDFSLREDRRFGRSDDVSDSESRPMKRRPATAPSAHLYVEDQYDKAVIYPMAEHPHTRNVRRCDPVNRFHEFRQYWRANKVPGEKTHKSLRWSVRENMLYHDPVVKKTHRPYVANDYVVPTDKKRSSLRWQVRAQLAQGGMPGSGYVSN